jgi:hypothetical protein
VATRWVIGVFLTEVAVAVQLLVTVSSMPAAVPPSPSASRRPGWAEGSSPPPEPSRWASLSRGWCAGGTPRSGERSWLWSPATSC